MQIIDIVIIALLALFLIIGLIRGMIKMTFGLLAGLASLVIAVLLTTTVAGLFVTQTPVGKSLSGALYNVVNVGGTELLVYDESKADEDVLGYYKTNEDGTRTFAPLSELMEQNAFLKIFGKWIESGIRESYTKEIANESPEPFSKLFCSWLAVIIIQVICFIVLWILCSIIFKVISILLKKLVGASYVGHFLDRILGAVVGAGVAFIIVMLCMTVLNILSPAKFMDPVNEHISQSMIGKELFDNNFIYKLLSAKIDFSAVLKLFG